MTFTYSNSFLLNPTSSFRSQNASSPSYREVKIVPDCHSWNTISKIYAIDILFYTFKIEKCVYLYSTRMYWVSILQPPYIPRRHVIGIPNGQRIREKKRIRETLSRARSLYTSIPNKELPRGEEKNDQRWLGPAHKADVENTTSAAACITGGYQAKFDRRPHFRRDPPPENVLDFLLGEKLLLS